MQRVATSDSRIPYVMSSERPGLMVVPLHPHLVDVQHRMNRFCRVLDLLLARNDTVFLNGSAIAGRRASVEPMPKVAA